MDPDRDGHTLTYPTHVANKSIQYFWSNISKTFSLMAFLTMFVILHYTPWLNHYYPTLLLTPDRVAEILYYYLFSGTVEIVTDIVVKLISHFYLKIDISFHATVATILDTRTRFFFAIALLLVFMDTPISLVQFVL